MRVAIFTDDDFSRVNGITTTFGAVSRHSPALWEPRIYTAAESSLDLPDYFAAASIGVGLPWHHDTRIYWPRFRRFARELRHDGVGVIHITTPGPVGLAARYLAARLKLPSVGSYHSHLDEYIPISNESDRLAGLTNRYLRWLYGPCSSLLVPSWATRDLLTRQGHCPERLRYWSRGVEADQFSPARASGSVRRRWGVDDRRPAVLYVGRLCAEKGLALIAPIQRQLHRHGVAHRFIFAGDGPMADTLQRECPEGVFLGNLPHDDVAVAMASADLLLFPSATDAFGDVVLEGLASGLPVVVSDRGGPAEYVKHDATGYICRAGDAGGFAQRLLELLRSPARRHAMAHEARQQALARTWPVALRPLFEAWEDAARGRMAGGRDTRPSGRLPAA